jgi:hypothetical protein
MNSDEERRYHERQHNLYMSEQRRFSSCPDMDFFRELELERREKERRESGEEVKIN